MHVKMSFSVLLCCHFRYKKCEKISQYVAINTFFGRVEYKVKFLIMVNLVARSLFLAILKLTHCLYVALLDSSIAGLYEELGTCHEKRNTNIS